MATSQHTPGPWTLVEEKRKPFRIFINAPDGMVLLSVERDWYHSGWKTLDDLRAGVGANDPKLAIEGNAEQLADLRVMAAAPDLLSACEAMVEVAGRDRAECGGGERYWFPCNGGLWRDVLAAIAKARGEA